MRSDLDLDHVVARATGDTLVAVLKPVTRMAVVILLALAGAGCECAGYDSLLLTVGLHTTTDRTWESMAGRTTKTGIPPEFLAWEAAIKDATAAAPSSSVLALNGPGGTLYLDVPLPLTVGQTFTVVREDELAALSFENVGPPRDSLGARYDDFCTAPPIEEQAACRAYQPPIQGAAQVIATGPLAIHLAFTIEGWPGGMVPPHLVIEGDLLFSATRGRACPTD
jgi:hypothetical protein